MEKASSHTSRWICWAFVFLIGLPGLASGVEYRLFPAQPIVGQEIIIQPVLNDFCTRVETIEAANLTGSTIHAAVEVRHVICPIQGGRADRIGRFINLEAGEYQLVIDEIGYNPDGSEYGRQTYSRTFQVLPDSFYTSTGMSGSWYNPEQSGHGLNLEFLADKRLVGYWYTFDANGVPVWLFLHGTYGATDARVEALEVEGGFFPPAFDPEMITKSSWGSIEFSFSDCSHASMSWDTDHPLFSSGEMEILKISPDVGIPCRDPLSRANENTFIPFVRWALDSEYVLVNDYSPDPDEPDWNVQHEQLPEHFNVPVHLGVDSALHITSTKNVGRLTLLSSLPRFGNRMSQDAIVELTLRLATQQEYGCVDTTRISFNLYSSRLEVVSRTDPNQTQGVPFVYFELATPAIVSETMPVGTAQLDQDGLNCEDGELTELTLRSSTPQLLSDLPPYIGLHFERGGDDNENSEIDLYLIEGNISVWPVVRPDSQSIVIPAVD